ncbi:MAG: hypothetical protein HY369_05270 [Candidatus Aenigmarchaeota archaeon]|nr:hypothetical protein [Candidatus Aenigmarchaeota archaeon]
MIIAILGIIDLIAGGALILGPALALEGSSFLFYFMILFFLKAIYSILTAVAAGFYFDLLGYLDFIAAVFLLLLFWGISPAWVFWIGLLVIIKGIYSFVIGFIST